MCLSFELFISLFLVLVLVFYSFFPPDYIFVNIICTMYQTQTRPGNRKIHRFGHSAPFTLLHCQGVCLVLSEIHK
ncbi:hypothetical protein BDV25DRAFT_152678 [Aspergillus avenaceus]|uniref:Uncharacterized protein n=1 Tax=Aspergillus avenaceus TaxID=36643 RepID=A0A5N6TZ41_ASPAV|nr:hypothetical protein BDV25DRAFT_152678 [Aspergillus avenaceus]